jgi:hypothetical protein
MFDGFILEHVPTIGAVARVRHGAAGYHMAEDAPAVPLSFLDGHSDGGA